MQGQLTNPAAITAAVDAWLADDDTAADLLMRLHPAARVLALRKLGYSTRQHLALFGLDDVPEDTIKQVSQ